MVALIIVCVLFGAHVILPPYMAVDLAHRHKVGGMTRAGFGTPSTWRSVLLWYGIVAAPLLGEVVWASMRRLPPTSTDNPSRNAPTESVGSPTRFK